MVTLYFWLNLFCKPKTVPEKSINYNFLKRMKKISEHQFQDTLSGWKKQSVKECLL